MNQAEYERMAKIFNYVYGTVWTVKRKWGRSLRIRTHLQTVSL